MWSEASEEAGQGHYNLSGLRQLPILPARCELMRSGLIGTFISSDLIAMVCQWAVSGCTELGQGTGKGNGNVA